MENCNPFPFNLTLVKRLRDEKHNCGVQILQKTVSSRQPVVFDTFYIVVLIHFTQQYKSNSKIKNRLHEIQKRKSQSESQTTRFKSNQTMQIKSINRSTSKSIPSINQNKLINQIKSIQSINQSLNQNN